MGTPNPTSSEILEAINIACDKKELRKIHRLLAKNHDATWDILEQGITSEAVKYITKYDSSGNCEVLKTYIEIVEADIKKILSAQKQPKKSEKTLEETLKNALQNKQVSEELLETVFRYIELFCAKYPPQKIPDWNLDQDQDEDEVDPFLEDYEIWQHALRGHNGEVEEKEINTLQQCMKAIKHCIEDVRLIALLHHIKPETRRLHISKRKNIINSLSHIMVYLRHITDRSDTHTPYHELSKPGQPFGPDRHGFGCRQLISTWEGLQGALQKLKNSENI